MSPRTRLIAIAGVVPVVLIVALVLLARSLLAPDRFTAMMVRSVADAGLQLDLDAPAHPTLWPHPAVEIDGLRLSLPGHDEDALLTARKLRLVMAWRALLQRETRIERLEIHSPRVDLAILKPWMDSRSQSSGSVVPSLPTIDAGVDIDDGSVYDGDALLLEDAVLSMGMLRVGEPFSLSLRARDAHARAVVLGLAGEPQPGAGIHLAPFRVGLEAMDHAELALDGGVDWRGGLLLSGHAAGTLRLGDRAFAIELDMQSTDAVTFRLDGAETRVAMSLAPVEAWQWWRDTFQPGANRLALPPMRGDAVADTMEWNDWRVQGLRIVSGAATASSTAPAAAATVAVPQTRVP